MINIGKKIISAFLEIPPDDPASPQDRAQPQDRAEPQNRAQSQDRAEPQDHADDRFAGHFDKLLSEANIPGPDYYEFARMIAVMQAIPDEASRYNAAFAGLQVQGLNKQRLLDTAAEYLRILTTDATQFQATVDGKEAETEEKTSRMQALSQEIVLLQQQISALQHEVQTAKGKLSSGSTAYSAESKRRQEAIRCDIEKINQFIH